MASGICFRDAVSGQQRLRNRSWRNARREGKVVGGKFVKPPDWLKRYEPHFLKAKAADEAHDDEECVDDAEEAQAESGSSDDSKVATKAMLLLH